MVSLHYKTVIIFVTLPCYNLSFCFSYNMGGNNVSLICIEQCNGDQFNSYIEVVGTGILKLT